VKGKPTAKTRGISPQKGRKGKMESCVSNCILYSHLNSWRHKCSAAEYSRFAVVLYVTAVVRVLTVRWSDAWSRCLSICCVFVVVLLLLLLNWFCVYLEQWRTLSVDIVLLSGRRYTIQTHDRGKLAAVWFHVRGKIIQIWISKLYLHFLLPCSVSNSSTLSNQAW
jgi:hypothetical protein